MGRVEIQINERARESERARDHWSAHPAVLVLVFLYDVVDCVQQLFDGAGNVPVTEQKQIMTRLLQNSFKPPQWVQTSTQTLS